MNQLIKAYLWLETFIPGLFFISIFIAMMMEIISRAVLGTSFAWSTEYCRYALVWVTFLGAVYVRRNHAHIQVLFLHQMLERRSATSPFYKSLLFLVNFIRFVVALAFWFFLIYFGYRLSARTTRFYSSAMAISQYWLYFCTVLCGLFAGIMELLNFIKLFKGDYIEPQRPSDDENATPEMLI